MNNLPIDPRDDPRLDGMRACAEAEADRAGNDEADALRAAGLLPVVELTEAVKAARNNARRW